MSASGKEPLTVRIAETDDEIAAAQRLRFEVFSRTRDAAFSEEARAARRDVDRYDPYCDHLIVIDPDCEASDTRGIIGTYRMLSRRRKPPEPGFYSDEYYDISCFDDVDGEIVEMGRVCIDPEYKSRGAMMLLWKGIAGYVLENDVHILFGCAGVDGTDANVHAEFLSYLHHKHLAPERIRPVARETHRLDFDLLPLPEVDEAKALKQIPSIIRGYSRMGGYVGEGAVANRNFNTTMVCIIVEVAGVTRRYLRHFVGDKSR